MKTLERLNQWLCARRARRMAKRAEATHKALARESEVVVQAREFDGEVYLCVNDSPIVPAEGLTWDLPTALAVARASWLKWKEKEACYERR